VRWWQWRSKRRAGLVGETVPPPVGLADAPPLEPWGTGVPPEPAPDGVVAGALGVVAGACVDAVAGCVRVVCVAGAVVCAPTVAVGTDTEELLEPHAASPSASAAAAAAIGTVRTMRRAT
jgi:hypothetical protein